MQMDNRILDDLARVASSAFGAAGGVKGEFETILRRQFERILDGLDMVSRDEFDAVKEMAANARSAQEALEKRVLDLEKKLGIKTPAKAKSKTKSRTGAKKKTQAKKRAKKKSPGKGKRG